MITLRQMALFVMSVCVVDVVFVLGLMYGSRVYFWCTENLRFARRIS